MARYRKIDVRLWGDKRFLALTPSPPCGQTLWLYLLTNPNTNSIPGLFRSGEAAMAEELGWPLEAFRKAFGEVIAQGLAKADWKARVIWLPNAPKYNKPESLNVVIGWGVSWDEIPECSLKLQAYKELKAYTEGLSLAFGLAFAKACPMPSAIQEQEQEQEQDNDGGVPPPVVVTEKTLTPSQRFVKDALEVYASVGAAPPAISLLGKWNKEFLKGNYAWTLRELNALAIAGHLSLGTAYVSKALQNIGNGNRGASSAPQPPVDTRLRIPMEDLP